MKLLRSAIIDIVVAFAAVGGAVTMPSIVSQIGHAVASNQRGRHAERTSSRDLSGVFQNVVKDLQPSVVNVSSMKRAPRRLRHAPRTIPLDGNSPFRGDFNDERPGGLSRDSEPEIQGVASGMIVTTDGYILTSSHAIQGMDEVRVRLSDGKTYRAEITGADSKTEVGVLKIDASGLTPAKLGDSDSLEVGEWILAIGSPFGLDQSVTAGIISAKGRANLGITGYEDFLQTDAAINPGNSGGPLVNLDGEVVGINTAIASQSGGYMGIGFAIPINQARAVMDSIIKDGKVRRAFLGAAVQDLNSDLADSFGYDRADGALIGDLLVGGPASRAGLERGDILVALNGRAIRSSNQLRNAIAAFPPGTTVTFEVFRDRKRRDVSLELGELPTPPEQAAPETIRQEPPPRTDELGVRVQEITPELASQFGVADNSGVIVTEVTPHSLAHRAGILRKDVILAIGDKEVRDPAEVQSALDTEALARGVRLELKLDGTRRYVFLKSAPQK